MTIDLTINNKKYVTVREAGKLTGYSKDYLSQLARSGKVDSRRVGLMWYVNEESVLQYKSNPTDFDYTTNPQLKNKAENYCVEINPGRKDANIGEVLPKPRFPETRGILSLAHFSKYLFPLTVGLIVVFVAHFLTNVDYVKLSANISTAPNEFYKSVDGALGFYSEQALPKYISFGEKLDRTSLAFVQESYSFFQSPPAYIKAGANRMAIKNKRSVDKVILSVKNNISFTYNQSLTFFSESLRGLSFVNGLAKESGIKLSAQLYSATQELNSFDKFAVVVYDFLKILFGVDEDETTTQPAPIPEKTYAVETPTPTPTPTTTVPNQPIVYRETLVTEQFITNPVVERIIERIVPVTTTGVTREYFEQRLTEANNKFASEISLQIAGLSTGSSNAVTNIYQQIAHTNKIDNLSNVIIGNPTISGGTVTNTNITAGTLTATSFSVPTITFSGVAINSVLSTDSSGVIVATTTPTFGNFNATSTTATSTISIGGLTVGGNHFIIQQNSGRIGLGTTTPNATLDLVQGVNGLTMFASRRATDLAPNGDFINYKTADMGTTLFRVDNSGNLLAGGIVTSGSQTITSVSVPQFRLQYDASNELTFSTGTTGSTTIATNGTNSALNFVPENNNVNAFNFLNAAGTSVFNIDTLYGRVGIGSTTPSHQLSISGSALFSGNLTLSALFATTSISTPLLTLSNTAINSILSTNSSGEIVATSTPTFGNFNATSTTATSTISTGGLAVGTNQFVVQQGSGNVGIGTLNPAGLLTVKGSTKILNSSDIEMFSFDPSNAVLSLGKSGTLAGKINFDGSPGEIRQDGVTQFDFLSDSIRVWRAFDTPASGSGNGPDYLFKTEGTDRFIIKGATGNVGVGTTTPWATLSVNSTGGTGAAFAIGSSTSSSFVVTNTGKMGLGTVNPDHILSIASGQRISLWRGDNGYTNTIYTNSSNNIVFTGQSAFHIDLTGGNSTLSNNTGTEMRWSGSTLAFNTANSAPIIFGLRGDGAYANDVDVRFGQIVGSNIFMGLGNQGVVTLTADANQDDVLIKRHITGTYAESGSLLRLEKDITGSSTYNSNYLEWGTTAADLGVINKDGKLGIGTTTPWAQLSINPNGITGPAFAIGSSTKTDFVVTSGGNVGIGTTNPGSILDVRKDANGGLGANLALSNLTTSSPLNTASAITAYGADNSGTVRESGQIKFINTRAGGWAGTGTWDSIMTFSTNIGTGLTEKMRIDNNGNVGIGTTPSFRTHILGTSGTAGATPIVQADRDNSGTLFKWRRLSTGAGDVVGTLSADSDGSSIGFTNSQSIYGQNSTGDMLFYTNSAERMRVLLGGRIVIGTSAAGNSGKVTIAFDPAVDVGLTIDGGACNGCNYLIFSASGAPTGSVSRNTTTNSVTYNTSSDLRLKENITPTERGLSELMNIEVRDYSFISDPNHTMQSGFIAQNLYSIYPEAVSVGGDNATQNPWSVDYGRVTPLLVKSIQELNLNIETIAGVNTTSTPEAESFASSFWTGFKTKLVAWFGEVGNGITRIFASEIRTEMLCVGETCVTEAQLAQLLANAGNNNQPSPEPEPTPEEQTPTDTIAPVITLNGEASLQIPLDSTYSDLGATVTDLDNEGVINNNLGIYFNVNGIDVQNIQLDTTATTTHTIIYSAVDQSGNFGYATRTVEVVEEKT